jgi:hypothetical protein
VLKRFAGKWNFPNCFGCTDGKHICLKCPTNAGSMYYNYKQYHSSVLRGIAVANYKLICIDVESYGKQSDGEIFSSSAPCINISRNKFLQKNVFQELK